MPQTLSRAFTLANRTRTIDAMGSPATKTQFARLDAVSVANVTHTGAQGTSDSRSGCGH